MRSRGDKLYSIKELFLNYIKKKNKNIYLQILLRDYLKSDLKNDIEYKIYSRKKLYLKVRNKSLITYYNLKKSELIQKINELAGEEIIKDIKFIL